MDRIDVIRQRVRLFKKRLSNRESARRRRALLRQLDDFDNQASPTTWFEVFQPAWMFFDDEIQQDQTINWWEPPPEPTAIGGAVRGKLSILSGEPKSS